MPERIVRITASAGLKSGNSPYDYSRSIAETSHEAIRFAAYEDIGGRLLLKQSGPVFIISVERLLEILSEHANEDEVYREATEESLTTRQAAERLGVTPRRIRQLIKSGQLFATMAGRDWLVDSESLDSLVKVHRRAGRPKKENKLDADA